MTKSTKPSSDFEEPAGLFVVSHAPDPDWSPEKARAYKRGLENTRRLLEETGGSLSLREVTDRLGISRQAVAMLVRNGKLFAVPGPSNRRRYPAIQFNENGGIVPGLREVAAALQVGSPYAFLWFLSTNGLVGDKKAIDMLQDGKIEHVVRFAQVFFEQGT